MLWNEILSFVFIACSALVYACSLQCNTKNLTPFRKFCFDF